MCAYIYEKHNQVALCASFYCLFYLSFTVDQVDLKILYSCYKSVKLFTLWKKIKCNVCMLLSFIYSHAVNNQLNDGWILLSWFHFRVLVLWMLITPSQYHSLVGHLTGGQPSLMLMTNIKFPCWKIDYSLDLHLVLQHLRNCTKKSGRH